jgi:ATP-dependent HslUV protease ATP-binding subunit HslU
MIRELSDLSVNMIKQNKTKEVEGKAQENADERILDILIPPVKKRATASEAVKTQGKTELGFNISNDDKKDNNEANLKTREKFKKLVKSGKLDERVIELDLSSENFPMLQVLGPIGLEEMGLNLQDMFGNMVPKKSKKKKLTIAEARKVLSHEESQKLIDMDRVIQEALDKVQNSGIVFIDEIDKISSKDSKSSSGVDVSREGVQRDLLPIIEGSTVITKYGPVKTDHILFIASGAFHISKPSDLIPELQGRFPIRVELNSLNEQDFYKILTQPENALIKQYKALLESENVELIFDDESIKEVAKIAAEVNEQVENIGARRLHTILTTLLEDILFEVPDKQKKRKIFINKKLVNNKLSTIVKNRDLSRYIL